MGIIEDLEKDTKLTIHTENSANHAFKTKREAYLAGKKIMLEKIKYLLSNKWGKREK